MALWTIRSVSRRRESPDRIAAVVSSWSRSRRVIGTLLGEPPAGVPRVRGGLRVPSLAVRRLRPSIARPRTRSGSALARSRVLLALRFLALPLHRRLLVVLTTTRLGEDPALLDLLVEAAEGAFERLVLAHSDFGQTWFTSSGRSCDARSHARCPTARGRPDGLCVLALAGARNL